MKTKEEIAQKFEEFNRESKPLFEMSFQEKLKGSGVKLSWSREDKKLRTEFRGPDDESIKAYCNDLRKFIQKNDSLKIEKLAPFYQSNLVSQKNKRFFGQQMSEIDKFLKASTNHTLNGKTYTNQEILEIFLYGKVSHRTEGKKEVHDSLEKSPLYLSLKNIFVIILHRYLVLINNLVFINKEVLSDFNKKQNKIEWKEIEIGELLDYEQPGKYIVDGEILKEKTKSSVPVLTANKSFILGYTEEKKGIYDNPPVIIFDDFTTDTKFVDFKFKVKSSAMKLLKSKSKDVSLKFVFLMMKGIQLNFSTHKRYYLSVYQKRNILMPFSNGKPDLKEQERIVKILDDAVGLNEKGEAIKNLFDEYLKTLFYEMFLKEKNKFEVVNLKEVCPLFRKIISPEKINEGYIYLGLEHIESKTGIILERLDAQSQNLKSAKFLFDKDCILYGKLRPYLNKIALPNFNGICSTDIIPLKPIEEKSDKYYITHLLRRGDYVNRANSLCVGANLPRLSPRDLENFEIPLPPISLQKKFSKIVEQVEKMKDSVNKTKQNSEELFNSLVSKGFRGEL
jgi:type I restriction enzyme S subunit